MITLDFLLTSLIIVLIPGTGVIYTISTGVIQGRIASIYAALGCTAGIIPHLAATLLGLAAILHTSAVIFQLLKYAGVAYLFYLAYVTWCTKSNFQVDHSVARQAGYQLIMRGFLLNILNPKLSIFFLAFLPQFIHEEVINPLFQLLVLSMVFMLMTFIVFVIYGMIAHAFRQLVIESRSVQEWLRRGFTAAFVGLGLNLATAEQR